MQINQNIRDQLNFLQPCFLQQLKKQCFRRIKPSKSILDALKHSQFMNKQLKIKNQELRSQVSHSKQQIEILKKMLEKYTIQLQEFKFFKENKIQKLYQNESQMKINIHNLQKLIISLKKQNRQLKRQRTSLDNSKTYENKRSLNFKIQDDLSQLQIIENLKNKSSYSQICQTATFHEYVNFSDDDIKNANKQTQINSKNQIQINQTDMKQNTNMKQNYCKNNQLMKMLQLAHSSKDIQHQNDQEQDKSIIKQIVSENQLTVEDENSHVIAHPITHIQNRNQRNMLLITFKPYKTQQKQMIIVHPPPKPQSYGNLRTDQSIQQKLLIRQNKNNQFSSIRILSNHQNVNDNEYQLQLHDMSNCDYNGLLNDIYLKAQDDIPPFIDPSQLQQKQQNKKIISFKSFNIKQTVSIQVQSNQKIQPKKKNYLKKKQAIRASKLKQDTYNSQITQQFCQNRYKNNTQSYKTIDLQQNQLVRQTVSISNNKSITASILNDDNNNDQSVIIVNADQIKTSKGKYKKNHLMSSKISQGGKSSSGSHKMMNASRIINEKLSIFNNRRGNNNKNNQKFNSQQYNQQSMHYSQINFLQNNINNNLSRSQMGFNVSNKNDKSNQRSQIIQSPTLKKKSGSSNNLSQFCNRKKQNNNNEASYPYNQSHQCQ